MKTSEMEWASLSFWNIFLRKEIKVGQNIVNCTLFELELGICRYLCFFPNSRDFFFFNLGY